MCNWSPQRTAEYRTKKTFEEILNGRENFKFDDNYKPVDPRISLDTKYKKHARNCMKADNTQFLQTRD